MKQGIVLICFALTLGLIHASPKWEGEEKIGVVVEPAVLYIGHPDRETAMAYLRIPQGTEVKIIGQEAAYFKILHKELIGYVKSKTVKPLDELDEEVVAPKPPLESPQPARNTGYYTLTQETSLREEPDSKARVIARFDEGDRVEVLEDSGKYWWKVVYKGKTGWAKAALLKKE